MSGGGGGGGTTTVVTHGLPEYGGIPTKIEAYLDDALNLSSVAAYRIYSTDTAFRTSYNAANPTNLLPSGNPTYPQDQDASTSTYNTGVSELTGINAVASRASGGDTSIDKARSLISNNLDGTNYDSNTKLDSWFDKEVEKQIQVFEEDGIPSLDQEAVLLGRFGSPAHQKKQYKLGDGIQENLALIGKNIYYDDYKRERVIVHASSEATHAFANESLRDMDMLRKAGLYVREYAQGKADDAYRSWQEEQEAPIKALDILGNGIRSMTGAQVEKTEPFYRPSTFSQIAGLALTTMPIWASMSQQRSEVKKGKNEEVARNFGIASRSGAIPTIPGGMNSSQAEGVQNRGFSALSNE